MPSFEDFCEVSEVERRFSLHCLANLAIDMDGRRVSEMGGSAYASIEDSLVTVLGDGRKLLTCNSCQAKCIVAAKLTDYKYSQNSTVLRFDFDLPPHYNP